MLLLDYFPPTVSVMILLKHPHLTFKHKHHKYDGCLRKTRLVVKFGIENNKQTVLGCGKTQMLKRTVTNLQSHISGTWAPCGLGPSDSPGAIDVFASFPRVLSCWPPPLGLGGLGTLGGLAERAGRCHLGLHVHCGVGRLEYGLILTHHW